MTTKTNGKDFGATPINARVKIITHPILLSTVIGSGFVDKSKFTLYATTGGNIVAKVGTTYFILYIHSLIKSCVSLEREINK